MADMTTSVPLPRKYWPDVTAPAKASIAACLVVSPVPPLAIGKVPVTPGVIFAEPLNDADDVLARFVWMVLAVVNVAALPVVFWFRVGMSAATTARKVGTPAEPLGAAKKKLAVLLAYGFCVSP